MSNPNYNDGGGSPEKQSAYNFETDTLKIENVIATLSKNADDLETEFDTIYQIINDLNEYWSGMAYETFRNKCYTYKPAMDALVLIFRAYAHIFENEVTEAESTLSSSINSAFGNLE